MTTYSRVPWWVPLLVAAVFGLTSTFISDCGHIDRELTQRVQALEAHRDDDKDRLDRIEGKLDRLDDKLDRLIKWALGK